MARQPDYRGNWFSVLRYRATPIPGANSLTSLTLAAAMFLFPSDSPAVELLVEANGVHFGPGDAMELSIGLDETEGANTPVDAYFAVIPPGSDSALFISGGPGTASISPGLLTNPATWTPLAEGVVLSQIGDVKPAPWLTVPIPETLATGDYRVAFATTMPGTLEVVNSVFLTLRVLENSIKANLGLFTGDWFNTTFTSTGPMLWEIRELAPGSMELFVDLDGFVGGAPDPDPETYPFTIDDLTGNLDFQIIDPDFFNGPVFITLSSDGEIEVDIPDVGMAGFVSFNATGARVDDAIEMDYTVSFGIEAVGTISVSRAEN